MNQTERTDRADALAHAVALATAGHLPPTKVVDYANTLRGFLSGERAQAQFPAADVDRAALERRTGPGECGHQRALTTDALLDARCILQPGHEGRHSDTVTTWPQAVVEPPAPQCGDVRDGSICRRPAGHVDAHSDTVTTWPQAARCGDQGGPEGTKGCRRPKGHAGDHGYAGTFWEQAAEVPARHCGSVKYWQPARDAADMRSVCTLPAGHPGDHHGPDQTATNWNWEPGTSCGASFDDLRCELTVGHTGSHYQGDDHWQNALQPA